MEKNYYILSYPFEDSSLWDITIDKKDTVITNLAKNKMIVKVYKIDANESSILKDVDFYTKEEVAELTTTNEWTN